MANSHKRQKTLLSFFSASFADSKSAVPSAGALPSLKDSPDQVSAKRIASSPASQPASITANEVQSVLSDSSYQEAAGSGITEQDQLLPVCQSAQHPQLPCHQGSALQQSIACASKQQPSVVLCKPDTRHCKPDKLEAVAVKDVTAAPCCNSQSKTLMDLQTCHGFDRATPNAYEQQVHMSISSCRGLQESAATSF